MSNHEMGMTLLMVAGVATGFAGMVAGGAWLGDRLSRNPWSVTAPLIGAVAGMLAFVALLGLALVML